MGISGSGGSSYSHSSSGVSRQKPVDNGPSGYQTGSVKRHVARWKLASEFRIHGPGLSSIDAVPTLDTVSRHLETIKIIYSTLFSGLQPSSPSRGLGQKWKIMYSDYSCLDSSIYLCYCFNERWIMSLASNYKAKYRSRCEFNSS